MSGLIAAMASSRWSSDSARARMLVSTCIRSSASARWPRKKTRASMACSRSEPVAGSSIQVRQASRPASVTW
ncbi:hypothetical protein ACFPRL_19575 [Pseudoclavibacter helvolus]